MDRLARLDAMLVGVGMGLLGAALVGKLLDLEWVVVGLGVLLLVVGGTGVLSSRGAR